MKMKLFYVVKEVTNAWTEEKEFTYVAGPFSFDGACTYRRNQDQPYKYGIAEQEIEVN